MRYLILLLLLISCSMPTIDTNWDNIDYIPEEMEKHLNKFKYDKYLVFEIYHSISNIVDWKVYANGFQPVAITMQEKKGNCANRALTKLAYVKKILGIKGKLIFCYARKKNGGYGLHYAVNCNGMYDMPKKKIITIYEEISYDDIAEYIYTRQGGKL